MNKITLLLTVLVILFVAGLFLTQAMWGWVVPDLFPGAVEQGLITDHLSLWMAFKLNLFVSLVLGVNRSSSRAKS